MLIHMSTSSTYDIMVVIPYGMYLTKIFCYYRSIYLMRTPPSFTQHIYKSTILASVCHIPLMTHQKHPTSQDIYVYGRDTLALYLSQGYSRLSGIPHHDKEVGDIPKGDEDIPSPSDNPIHTDPYRQRLSCQFFPTNFFVAKTYADKNYTFTYKIIL